MNVLNSHIISDELLLRNRFKGLLPEDLSQLARGPQGLQRRTLRTVHAMCRIGYYSLMVPYSGREWKLVSPLVHIETMLCWVERLIRGTLVHRVRVGSRSRDIGALGVK